MVPGWDLRSSDAALELAEHHAPFVQAAVGVHPHHAAAMDERAWSAVEALIADPRCAAVGEIGLDFFRNLSPPEAQQAAFERQLEIAAARDLPVLVHDRDAHDAVSTTLLAWAGRRSSDARGVMHAFSGDAAMAGMLTERGFLISFALPLSFRSAVGARAAAAAIGAATYLVETDAPHLGPDRNGRNEPTTVLRVAAELARLRTMEPQAVADEVRRAYDRMIGE